MFVPVVAVAADDLDSSREKMRRLLEMKSLILIEPWDKKSFEQKSVGVWCCSLTVIDYWGPISPSVSLLFSANRYGFMKSSLLILVALRLKIRLNNPSFCL